MPVRRLDNLEGRLLIREGGADDDGVCGRIVGAAASRAVYAARLPHARATFEDTSPLALDGRLRMVAELDGEPIGFADYLRSKGHVKYLFVLPEAQGSGAGAALLEAVQKVVGGPVSVHVLAVNDTGLLWYLRWGFRVESGFAEVFEGVEAMWLRLVRDGIEG